VYLIRELWIGLESNPAFVLHLRSQTKAYPNNKL
jgi:hypothetical protein